MIATAVLLTATAASALTPVGPAGAGATRVGVVGDSLTYFAGRDCGLQRRVATAGYFVAGVDGRVGRIIVGGIPAWQVSWHADVAVVGLGTNDTRLWPYPNMWSTAIQALMRRIGPRVKVVWVNVWRWDSAWGDPARGRRLASQFNRVLNTELAKFGRRVTIVN